MSKKSDALEHRVATFLSEHVGKQLPARLPSWMAFEGIVPSADIINVRRIGSMGGKTDVIVELRKSPPLKISVKLPNADYLGNWYGHDRVKAEFGDASFQRLTQVATRWGNEFSKRSSTITVGVSISLGRRVGSTGIPFSDVFNKKDVEKTLRGSGPNDGIANCVYMGDGVFYNLEGMLNELYEISRETIAIIIGDPKVIFRTVNPQTNRSNLGKNVYTQFQPYEPLPKKKKIQTASELFPLGRFVPVKTDRLNHNHILNDLEDNYNIFIPRK